MDERKVCFCFQRGQQFVQPVRHDTVLPAQLGQQLFCLFVQPRFVFVRTLLPYEAVLVRIGFDLRTVHEQMLVFDLAHLMQHRHQLGKDLLCAFRQALAPKPGNLKVAGCRMPFQQPDVIDIPLAGGMDLS